MIKKQLSISDRAADAIIVGSGMTGGWAAKELSEAGLKTLVLEAGPYIDASEAMDEPVSEANQRQDLLRRQPVQSRHAAFWSANPKLFVDDIDHPYAAPEPYLWIRGRQVGGRSLLWGGVTLRFSDFEFRDLSSDSESAWPIVYADLAPFYDVVERFLHVQGARDGLRQLPDGSFEPPPPLTGIERKFRESVAEKWPGRPVIIARGVPLEHSARKNGAPGWPPKANLSNTLERALATGRTLIRPDSIVTHLLAHPNQPRIAGAACLDRETGKSFEVTGRVIFLCASAIESVRILLNSKCRQHPSGIGNSSGLLGHCLLDHQVVWISGTTSLGDERMHHEPLGGAHGILIPRFRNLDSRDGRFAGGYGIWGGMHRSTGGRADGNSWFLNAIMEGRPRRENKVEIDDEKSDAWGIPSPRITYRRSENDDQMKDDALRCMVEMCRAAGLDASVRGSTLPGQYVHELGGARMGLTPSDSVLNRVNQCWDAPNLFVVDGSCFTTSGWQNPALTMMALTVRACAVAVGALTCGSL